MIGGGGAIDAFEDFMRKLDVRLEAGGAFEDERAGDNAGFFLEDPWEHSRGDGVIEMAATDLGNLAQQSEIGIGGRRRQLRW